MTDRSEVLAAYSRETALCVEFAYDATEEDLLAEMGRASGETAAVLNRVLHKLRERRAVLDRFTKVTAPKAA